MENFLRYHWDARFDSWFGALSKVIQDRRAFLDHATGNFEKFGTVVAQLPVLDAPVRDLAARAVRAGAASDLESETRDRLRQGLESLCPWRKGPFELFGIRIDSEWQSWMKWERLFPHLPADLKGCKILDIGSSNGYYMFRAAAGSPKFVLGLEPQSSFYCQYLAVQKYLRQENVFCLPIPYHGLPKVTGYFDLVFCMGILYHRKSPVEMLRQVRESLSPDGMIVLENLVLEGRRNLCLFPHDRYAKMRNVFFIPDLSVMESWLVRAGFGEIRCVDVTPTSCEEQRRTPWIHTESLADFLDPSDPALTVEGYPAPVRAVFTARA